MNIQNIFKTLYDTHALLVNIKDELKYLIEQKVFVKFLKIIWARIYQFELPTECIHFCHTAS